MYHELNFPVSVEEFAAYLDGNLSEREMSRVGSIIHKDSSMQELLEASQLVSDTMDSYSAIDLELPEEISNLDFDLPELENIGDFNVVTDIFSENTNPYYQEDMTVEENEQQETELLKKNEDMTTHYRTYGEAGENAYDPIYIKQPDDHSCGLRSQQIVLRDFGIDIPFEDLERYALNAGVYSETGGPFFMMRDFFGALTPNKYLEDKIFGAILSEEEIADNASPTLADIRRHKKVQSAKIRDSLQKIISSPAYAKSLREPIITIRDGRYVVPVKSECKNDVPGLVHDISGSGGTLFVEPMSAVNANNALRELELKEKKEIERILAEMSAEAAAHREDINTNVKILVDLDVIFAKAICAFLKEQNIY